jgi:hypothetical protein
MKALKLTSIIFLLTVICIFSQTKTSLQFTGGIISPTHTYKGLIGSVQITYPLNKTINLYFYSGYSSWDKNKVKILQEWSPIQHETTFTSYSEDNHNLIPIFVGAKINFHENKIFTAFINAELGYSYLTYNYYRNLKEIDPTTGEVLSYYADRSSKQIVKENLWGCGIGIGLSHPLTRKVNLIFEYKLNSYFNSKYSDFFGPEITWSIFAAGFNVSI